MNYTVNERAMKNEQVRNAVQHITMNGTSFVNRDFLRTLVESLRNNLLSIMQEAYYKYVEFEDIFELMKEIQEHIDLTSCALRQRHTFYTINFDTYEITPVNIK